MIVTLPTPGRLLAATCLCMAACNPDPAMQVVEEAGLPIADAPVADRVGWQPPGTVAVAGDEELRRWLQPAAPGVRLLPVPRDGAMAGELDKVDALIGNCDAALVAAAPRLRWIHVYTAGADECVNLPRVASGEILLTNMQKMNAENVAGHALALVLALTRGLHVYQREQQERRWQPAAVSSSALQDTRGMTLLVVGLGGIGTEVARRASGLGMRVIATRRSSREGPGFVDYVGLSDELAELAAQADVVVNTAPLTDETEGLFDRGFFQAMKPGAYFVNVARGGSVVTEDLVAALASGRLAGAGLDVTDPEPLPESHPLWAAPNVIITPHVAAGGARPGERYWLVVRENLRRYVAGEAMINVVDPAAQY